MMQLFKLVDNMSRVIAILLLGILCGSAFAEKCTSDKNCSFLDHCDLKFRFCVVNLFAQGVIALVVVLIFCLVIAIAIWSCRRKNNFRRHLQYLPQRVITTNTPPRNQQQTGVTTTTVYPHNPQPNQFSTDSDNPPAYNKVARINANHIPSAPPAEYV